MANLLHSVRHICSVVHAPRCYQAYCRKPGAGSEARFGLQRVLATTGVHQGGIVREVTVMASLFSSGHLEPASASQSPTPFLMTQVRGVRPAIRDPDRPKRPLTAWLRFLADFRRENPELKKDALKAASEKWRVMPAAQKQPWVQSYEADKREYDTLYKAYVDSGKKAAWERPPGKPTRPKTAFLLYSMEYRDKNPHLKMTEQTQLAAALWKDMSPEQKKPYEQKYAQEKEAYTEALTAYKESGAEKAWKDKVGITTAEEKKRAAEEKKKAAEEKKKAAAEKKKAAAEKKKAAAEKKKAAVEKNNAPVRKNVVEKKAAAGEEKAGMKKETGAEADKAERDVSSEKKAASATAPHITTK
eukprot:CAMPEP_0179036220 /NCGR_PEP_ID=MMETSP0796-20121207/13506_1 /TAXON_ID=73915 /ORGANISM="Pyrodinium bahamense, Strain pbaha01" /LENGTH=357 /DNA_ID=CAMNT_0020732501 /DNA_START=97 /DNA_END=1170 /DNA_ORIENTATION=-